MDKQAGAGAEAVGGGHYEEGGEPIDEDEDTEGSSGKASASRSSSSRAKRARASAKRARLTQYRAIRLAAAAQRIQPRVLAAADSCAYKVAALRKKLGVEAGPVALPQQRDYRFKSLEENIRRKYARGVEGL